MVQGIFKTLHNHSDLYANKLPSDSLGCPLKLATPLRNYIWVKNDKNESTSKCNETEMKSLEFVFKKLNFTMTLGSSEPKNSDFVSITKTKLYFPILTWQIPLIYEITTVAHYTISHDSYNGLWFVPCGRYESQVTTVSRIFSVSVWRMIVLLLFVALILIAFMGAYFKRNDLLETSILTNVTACLFTLWAVTVGVSSSELPHTPESGFSSYCLYGIPLLLMRCSRRS
jgi:hypothetical protein